MRCTVRIGVLLCVAAAATMVGLHLSSGASAQTDARRIDMAELLSLVLGLESGDPYLDITSPEPNAVFLVPEGTRETPLAVAAEAGNIAELSGGRVEYFLSRNGTGEMVSIGSSSTAPYLVPLTALDEDPAHWTGYHLLRAAAGVYESAPLAFSVTEAPFIDGRPGSQTNPPDGLPDNPFFCGLKDRDILSTTFDGGPRIGQVSSSVALLTADSDAPLTIAMAHPRRDRVLAVDLPARSTLLAGLTRRQREELDAEAAVAVLVVWADTLRGLTSAAPTDLTFSLGDAVAADSGYLSVNAIAYAGLSPDLREDQFEQIARVPGGIEIAMSLEGDFADIDLWHYPTVVGDNAIISPDDGAWTYAGLGRDVDSGVFRARTQRLGLLVPAQGIPPEQRAKSPYSAWLSSLTTQANAKQDAREDDARDATLDKDVSLSVDSIDPDTFWVFGGLVAKITGSGFDSFEGRISVSVGEMELADSSFAVLSDTEMLVLIPEYSAEITGDSAHTKVKVTATNAAGDPSSREKTITYVSRQADPSDVTTTALVFEDGGVVALDLRAGTEATLSLPAETDTAKQASRIFVLARTAKTANAFASAGEDIEALFADGQAIDGAWRFDIHLFEEDDIDLDNATAYDSTLQSASFAETPVVLSFPLDGADVLPALAENGGLSMFRIDSEITYDHPKANTANLTLGEAAVFESNLLPSEYESNTAGTAINTVSVRIYDGNGTFALRKAAYAPLPNTVDIAIVDPESGRLVTVAQRGDALNINSSTGGLYHVKQVRLTDDDGDIIASIAPAARANDGTSITFVLPAFVPDGAYTVALDLTGDRTLDLDQPIRIRGGGNPGEGAGLIAAAIGAVALVLGLSGGGGGGGSSCFIATAAYGTPISAHIDVLRALRDTYLLTNPFGTAFVDVYYQISPAVADVVARLPWLAAGVRAALIPVVFFGKILLDAPGGALIAALAAAVAVRTRRLLRRANG